MLNKAVQAIDIMPAGFTLCVMPVDISLTNTVKDSSGVTCVFSFREGHKIKLPHFTRRSTLGDLFKWKDNTCAISALSSV